MRDDKPRSIRDDNRSNDQPAYNRDDRRNDSPRPAFNRDNKPGDDRPRFNRDDRKGDDNRTNDRPRFDRNDESRPRFNRDENRSGDRPAFNRDGKRGDDRPRFDRGERPAFNRDNRRSDESRPGFNRDESRSGDRPAYNRDDKPTGDRPAFNRDDRRPERPAFNREDRRPDGPPTDRPKFDRNSESRPQFDRDENRSSDRPALNRASDRPTSDRPAFNRDNNRGDEFRPRFNRDNRSDEPRPRFDRDTNRNDESRPRFNRDDNRAGDRPAFNRDNRGDESRPRFSRDDERKNDRPAFKRDDRESASRARFDRRGENSGNDRAPRSERGSDRNDSTPRRTGRYENAPNYNLGAIRDGMPAKNRAAFTKATGSSRDAEAGVLRLNRYIANAGVCSRREADELIAKGDVSVNGQVITEMGHKVKSGDIVKYANKVLNPERIVYLLLNKPKGYITTTDDPKERQTVMDLIEEAGDFRLYPVGRLDRNTTGLLLMTNDGELAEKLTHPSNNIKKIYQIELDKPITEEHFLAIKNGIELEDGMIKPDDVGIVTPDAQVVGIEIHSGRNRIVRRIFEHLGYEVTKLDRTTYAGLTKKDLPRGKWRFLDPKEVVKLKYFNN